MFSILLKLRTHATHVFVRFFVPLRWIAVSINDKADVIFGGSDEPTALGCLYSIGAIATESNGLITSDVSMQKVVLLL